MNATGPFHGLRAGDVLVVVDVQVDFVSGALAVPHAGEVIAPLNECIEVFAREALPIVATRDWHPADHASFRDQGGPWPRHCVADSPGAAFFPGLALPADAWIVSKATRRYAEAYSGFEGTDLGARLQRARARRLFVGGLATDYCVLRTVLDALASGYVTFVIEDAIRAVNVRPGDGEAALGRMRAAGAVFLRHGDLLLEAGAHA